MILRSAAWSCLLYITQIHCQSIIYKSKKSACSLFKPTVSHTQIYKYQFLDPYRSDPHGFYKSDYEFQEELLANGTPLMQSNSRIIKKQSNYKRECVHEICSAEEFLIATQSHSSYMQQQILNNICNSCNNNKNQGVDACVAKNTFTCINAYHQVECVCKGNFGGKYCQYENFCASKCHAAGTYTCGLHTQNKCECEFGFHGEFCQIEQKCKNPAKYISNPTDSSSDRGFSATEVSIKNSGSNSDETQHCDKYKCNNCVDANTYKCGKRTNFKCVCKKSYEGRFCEKQYELEKYISVDPNLVGEISFSKTVKKLNSSARGNRKSKNGSVRRKRYQRDRKKLRHKLVCTDSDLKNVADTESYCQDWYKKYEDTDNYCQAVYRCLTTEPKYDHQRKKCKKTCQDVRRRFYIDSFGSNSKQKCKKLFRVDFDTGIYYKAGSKQKYFGYLISHKDIGKCTRETVEKRPRRNRKKELVNGQNLSISGETEITGLEKSVNFRSVEQVRANNSKSKSGNKRRRKSRRKHRSNKKRNRHRRRRRRVARQD